MKKKSNQSELCERGTLANNYGNRVKKAKIISRWPLKERKIIEKMAATATTTGVLKIGVPAPAKSGKQPTNFARLAIRYPNCFLKTRLKFPAIRALGQGGNPSGNDDTGAGGFINQVCVFANCLLSFSI